MAQNAISVSVFAVKITFIRIFSTCKAARLEVWSVGFLRGLA